MKRCFVVGCALAVLVCALSRGSAQRPSSDAATDVHVRLFSTQSVRVLRVVPDHATLRLCAACPAQPMMAPGTLVADAGGMTLDGKRVRSVWMDGQLKLAVEGGRTARGAGRWQVAAAADGLRVLLTIPSERYVMGVVQSEAAPDEPMESLKALAVVARSFALVNRRRHNDEGLCDSTHCQAMRMDRVPECVEAAVKATAGETLWFGGRRVEGYFMQNCGGVTADAAEVWGGPHKPWLVSHTDVYCQRLPSQWRAAVDERQMREALAAEGFRVGGPLSAFRVVVKDSSGRASRVELVGGGQRLVVSASSLRFAVNRALGWNTLRSDWYQVQIAGGRVVFEGKGYGHGVGLCQAGAAEMARAGKGYREILRAYFAGAAVRVDPGDDGWREIAGLGWALRLVGGKTLTQRPQRDYAKVAKEGSGEDVVTAGDAAWAWVRNVWKGSMAVRPVVSVAPTTELFRQMTGQPGWALASTAGNDVVLQPLEVVRSHGSLEDLLRHEFLHVLVEAEAGDAAPLWLREGLVEMLAGERGAVSAMSAAQIDEALHHAGSLHEAQAAHTAACGLVRRLVAQRGATAVRGWLRSGVPHDIVLSAGAGK